MAAEARHRKRQISWCTICFIILGFGESSVGVMFGPKSNRVQSYNFSNKNKGQ